MSEKNKAVIILKKAQEDFDAGKISRRDFNLLMMSFGALAGYTLFSSFAQAWTGTRMRKSSGALGYQIQRSLRFRSSASAYLARTMTTPTNNKKFTWSGWFKLGSTTAYQVLFSASFNSTNGLNYFAYNGLGQFFFYYEGGGMKTGWFPATLFRDPSAWYHVVLSVDTTQASYTTMVNIYINGVAQTLSYNNYSSTYVVQNTNLWINSAITHNIGRDAVQGYSMDSYLSEIYFVDGQSLTAASFGQADVVTGAWTAKRYAGTYGVNGFYLPFTDTSNTTNLVKDSSGNNNNWTSNNISLTAGTTYDSMLDTPLGSGGNERGNYCTLNPLCFDAPLTLSAANLNSTTNVLGNWSGVSGTIAVSSGQWYWETTAVSSVNPGTEDITVGIQMINFTMPTSAGGYSAGSYAYITSGSKINNTVTTAYGATWTNGDIIGTALDLNAGTLSFYKNGVSQGVAFSGLSGTFTPAVHHSSYPLAASNFGQHPFTYAAPAGFKNLHTGNLPTPAIVKSNQYFDITSYAGDSAASRVFTNSGMQPDLVWLKARNAVDGNLLVDSIRGVNKNIKTDTNTAETSGSSITSFNSNGFTGDLNVNVSGRNYIAWQWKKGVTSGFDIVTYTGDGNNSRQIPHSLGVTPAFYMTKNRNGYNNTNGFNDWNTFHKSTGALTSYMMSTIAAGGAGGFAGGLPTSTYFYPNQTSYDNVTGQTYVAYIFAEVYGFSKIGSYTGNGSTNGPFVYCGFRPKYILLKRTDSTSDWYIHDSVRDPGNYTIKSLFPNLAAVENSTELESTYGIDFLSNGFKIRASHSTRNASGGTYIFMAFAEAPFKYANAR